MRMLKPLLAVGNAASLVIVLCSIIGLISEPGDRIHDFIFERSAVQYVTLFTFALAITLLGHRLIRHVQSARELSKLRKIGPRSAMPDSPLGRHIRALREALIQHGAASAIALAERFTKERDKEIQQGYEVINFLVCSLPALGLFGTMLGLSSALSVAFSNGSFGKESIQGFVGSLGTALDTTVLALACALVIGMLVWLFNRIERLFHEQCTEVSHSAVGLTADTVRTGLDKQRLSSTTGSSVAPEKSPARIQLVIAKGVKSMVNIMSGFKDSIDRLEETVRTNIEHFTQSQTEHDQHMSAGFEAVYSHFNEAIERIGNLVADHNNETTRTIASAINRFAEAVEASNVVNTIRAEVRAGMAENMTEVASRFDASLGRLEELVSACFERSSLDEEKRNEVAKDVTSCLTELLERIGELIAAHNTDGAERVSLALDRFKGAMDGHIPQELIPSGQGHGGNGELDNVA